MSTLTINIQQKSNVAGDSEVTISLDGNLDNSTVASLEPKLNETLAASPAQLIFALADLKFVTSSMPDMRIFRDQAELDAYLLARQKTYNP